MHGDGIAGRLQGDLSPHALIKLGLADDSATVLGKEDKHIHFLVTDVDRHAVLRNLMAVRHNDYSAPKTDHLTHVFLRAVACVTASKRLNLHKQLTG